MIVGQILRYAGSLAMKFVSNKRCLEERQKVLRKINQTKRLLESGTDADGEKLSKKKRKELEKSLFERRVDLNYILVGSLAQITRFY